MPRAAARPVLLALLALLAPSPAPADPATEARLYFARGVALVEAGRWADAAERFLTSDRLAPNPNALFNAAACLERLDQRVEAFALLAEYRERVADDPAQLAEADAALARLAPQVARVRVVSEPAGATIWVDRRELGDFGTTPRTLALPAGRHAIELTRADHQPVTQTVEVAAGEERELQLVLPRRTGTLAVETVPPDAAVSVDGVAVSWTPTPGAGDVPTGRRRVVVSREGYRPETRLVDVAAEERTELRVELAPVPPPAGTLVVSGNVAGAEVVVDGRQRGFAPVVLRDVPAGSHEVVVRTDDGREWSETVEVVAGGSRWVNPEFQSE
jgi:hypothetical protein